MSVSAYEITAEIVSAYDDSKVGEASGMVTVNNEESYKKTSIAVAIAGKVAHKTDTATSFKEISVIVHKIVWETLIGSGANAGCQLGKIYYYRA